MAKATDAAISAAAAELEERMETRRIRNKASYLRYLADQKQLKLDSARRRCDRAEVELAAVRKLLGELVGVVR
jgi:hypothetical protein